MDIATGRSGPCVVPLSDCTKESVAHVGGKNANLGEMLRNGFPVPRGFAVSVTAFQQANEQILDDIERKLRGLDPSDISGVEKASAQVRNLVHSAGMPRHIQEEIGESYQSLSQECRTPDPPVAVRSSATAEDLPGASFAGQQDTYLWIRGIDNVLGATVRCWASLYTPRAICYRAKNNFAHASVSISVGIQQMVNARSAGVMFTLNPVNGDRSKISIGGSCGLGEAVVNGEVNCDEWIVDKVVLEIAKRKVATKEKMHVIHCEGGREDVVVKDIPPEIRDVPCLSDEEILYLAATAKAIERHYGRPQDIEWAVDAGLAFPSNIFIVQARPETVWAKRETAPILKTSTTFAAHVSGFYRDLKA